MYMYYRIKMIAHCTPFYESVDETGEMNWQHAREDSTFLKASGLGVAQVYGGTIIVTNAPSIVPPFCPEHLLRSSPMLSNGFPIYSPLRVCHLSYYAVQFRNVIILIS